MSPTDTADPLPVLLAPGTSVEPAPGQQGVGYGAGLDGQQQKVLVVGQASILPRSLDNGVLVDLTNAQGLSDPGPEPDDRRGVAGSGRPGEHRAASGGLRPQGRRPRDGGRPARRAREPGDHPGCRGRGDHQRRRAAAHAAGAGRRPLVGCRASRERLAGAARGRGQPGSAAASGRRGDRRTGRCSACWSVCSAGPSRPRSRHHGCRWSTWPPPDHRWTCSLDWWLIGAVGVGSVALIMIIAVFGALAEIRPRRFR